MQRAPPPSSTERRGRTGTRGRRRITTRSRWSAPSCATATSRRCRKSSALFAARELSPTTAAASTPKTLRTLSNIVASKEDLLYRALGVGRSRVEPQVREPHAVEALPAERGDLGVQALAQARDLGLRHGRYAEGPHHLLDLARGDAEHVHLGHRGDERAVRPAVAL